MTTNKPTIEERITNAMHSKDLSVEERVIGDVDFIIAAGWSQDRFGGAMLRLKTEWDGSPHRSISLPRKPSRAMIKAKAQQLAPVPNREHFDQARMELEAAYKQRVEEVLCNLKALPGVRRELIFKAKRDGCQAAEDTAVQVLLHWLTPVCPACCGRQKQLEKWSADELGDDACELCNGRGQVPVPGGNEGAGLANYIDDCVSRWRDSISKRMRH